ncbi:MAG: hypothetical protein L7F78_01730 [Syntrophales bacterium LBB04]|nr:hypothetical protein [Syntrophales bacterium LBB04]
MAVQDPRIQEALALLKANSIRCASEQEAIEKAREHPVHLDEASTRLLEQLVEEGMGYRKASFYFPERLLRQLEELANQGIDPTPLLAASLQSVLQVASVLLCQKQEKAV